MSCRVYRPPGDRGRLGALIFLHGDFGHLIDWRPVWRPFADREGFAILTPSYRWGFWDAGGVPTIDRAFEATQSDPAIDPGRVYLVGHSDGGTGVSHAVARGAGRYAGLAYLSGSMVDYTGLYLVSRTVTQREIVDPAFAPRWAGQRALILQGDRDWSVPKSAVDRGANDLRRLGVEVDYRVYHGRGHALFPIRRRLVFDALAGWIDRHRERTDPPR